MGVNYKIGADASQFNKSVNEAQANLKTLDAALKVNENSFKVAGDAQVYMSQKTQLLTDKMNKQKQLVTQLQQGLKQMREAGVAPTSVEYQKLEKDMLNAQNAMLETKQAIDSLDGSQQKGAKSAGELTTAVNSIGKKISLDQVISGINSITGALETAAGKAVKLGETIWTNVMDSAKWADDTATMALMYGIDLETFEKMQKFAVYGMETSVDAILSSQAKLNKNIGSGNKEALATLNELHIALSTVTGEDMDIIQRKDPAEVFFEIGNALMARGEGYDKEAAAQSLFGRNWKELIDLFTKFSSKEEFDKALEGVKVNSEEDVTALATLNDKVGELKENLTTLSNEVWAKLAPALTDAAEALNGVLTNVMAYLDTPQGQQALQDMQTAVSGLFEDLGKIDPEQVVSGFTVVFDTVVGSLQWLVENKEGLKNALTVIVGGWAAARLTGGALAVKQLIDGISGLSTGSASAAGAAAGSSWGTAFAAAVAKAAPWLIGLYALLNPSGTAGDDLDSLWDEKGKPTKAAKESGITWDESEDVLHIGENKTVIIPNLRNQADPNATDTDRVNLKTDNLSIDITPPLTSTSAGQTMAMLGVFGQWKKQYGMDMIGTGDASSASVLGRNAMNLNAEWENFKNEYLKAAVENASEVIRNFSEKQPITATPAGQTMTLLDLFWPKKNRVNGEEGVPITVEPVAEDNAAEDISKQVGPVEIPAILMVTSDHVNPWTSLGSFSPGGPAVFYYSKDLNEHANGIWSVPFDGYPAILHRGERVTPAQEISSQNYNSNLYVEKMYVNNGTDAQGLADVITARQRRKSRGYGS